MNTSQHVSNSYTNFSGVPSLTDHTNKQTISRLADAGMDLKYPDAMFEDYRKYLGELYQSPQDYIYLSRYVCRIYIQNNHSQ